MGYRISLSTTLSSDLTVDYRTFRAWEDGLTSLHAQHAFGGVRAEDFGPPQRCPMGHKEGSEAGRGRYCRRCGQEMEGRTIRLPVQNLYLEGLYLSDLEALHKLAGLLQGSAEVLVVWGDEGDEIKGYRFKNSALSIHEVRHTFLEAC